ncbi:hypothetical protein B0H17DRAFT_1155407 [Mycena rosella]|uniref:DNA helicase n=1 Tax=Mycena rosella TaxID=1033263 RepID=A0AAD7H2E1_MYCRO|nr:hypothetical protein B0H17DRAFT_1155407 [Mycena rosella]
MVSCNDLQTLASQAAKARNIHDIEFGGLSVILAGDFAQLPPTGGPALYQGLVSLRVADATTEYAQNSVLGRILWHQFTNVVILRQNMRQKGQTEADMKLRTALENMRYRSWTAQDIAFLRSRVASDRPGHPRLDTVKYRNVSVITALNIHKDAINNLGAKRFAQDTGQELHEFFSIDRLSPRAVDKHKWKKCEQAHFSRVGPHLQHQLWNATPSATAKHVPGCLQLCVGMPVMIKANDATELCITKGQEAVVKGWDDNVGPNGKRVLETLFVQLVKPPRPIQIDDLPLNVVPLPRASTHITALLRDDTLVSLVRDQTMVLPNFSMTDYGAQGKSRNPNVVHLNNCRTHMAYCVALSRGHRAEETAIIQGFDENMIKGGLTGYMRQEFRELELVDPSHWHPSIRGDHMDTFYVKYDDWRPTLPDKAEPSQSVLHVNGKRKAEEDVDVERPRKSAKSGGVHPKPAVASGTHTNDYHI